MRRSLGNSLSLLTLVCLVGCNIYQTPVDKQDLGLLKDDKTLGEIIDDFSDCGPIDFKAVDKKIFSPYCIDCHNEFDAAKNVRVDDYVEVINKLDRIKHQVEIDKMPKGKIKLSPEQKRFLYAWIYQGAKEKIDELSVESCTSDGSDFIPQIAAPVTPLPVEPVPPVEPPPVEPPPPSEPPPVVIPPVVIPPVVIPPIGNPTPPPTDPSLPAELYDYEKIKAQVFDPVCASCHGVRVLPALDTYEDVMKNIVKVESLVRGNQMPPRRPLADPLKAALFDWIQQGAIEKLPPQTP